MVRESRRIMITLCRKVQEYKTYYANGNIRCIYYRNKYGDYHNLDGPAYIRYYESGNKCVEEYYINGKYHRKDGPAYISYYENGNKTCEGYYINGKLHRKDGPAYISYYEDGNKRQAEYYINDHEYTLKVWLEKSGNNDNAL